MTELEVLPPTGVVLDEPEARALLYAAIAEDLADSDPMIGDGFVDGVLRTPPPQPVLDRALEQLVIGGKIWMPFPIPTDWHGSVFESGHFLGTPWEKSKEPVLEQIDSLVIFEMLHARGHSLTAEEFDGILDRVEAAAERWNALTSDSLIAFRVRQMVASTGWFDRTSPSENLIRAADELSAASAAFEPISRCIDTYTRVLVSAFDNSALSSLPFSGTPGSLLKVSAPPKDNAEHLAIASFVCQKLRTMPRAATLRETLALAGTPEAEALRQRLAEWTHCVRCADARMEIVQREIEYAQQELQAADSWSQTSRMYTVVAVPVAMLSTINPVLGGIFGATLTIGGFIAEAAASSLRQRNRWAMLGSANTQRRSA